MYKKGDFVATDTGKYVMILEEQISFDCGKVFVIHSDDYIYFPSKGWFSRLATEEEKRRLINLLLQNGYTWDEENLQLINEI